MFSLIKDEQLLKKQKPSLFKLFFKKEFLNKAKVLK